MSYPQGEIVWLIIKKVFSFSKLLEMFVRKISQDQSGWNGIPGSQWQRSISVQSQVTISVVFT